MKLNQYEWNPETDKLGEGSFAEVFKARDNNGDPVALKIYRSSMIQSGSTGSSNARYSLENEFLKGKHLSHTNIIRYIGLDYLLHTSVMQKEEKLPVLIMEFADAGSLNDRLGENANTDKGTIIDFEILDENEKISIAKQVLAGIGYLHEQGIIHRDLKPANILFKTDRMGRKVVKITDFGISRDGLIQNNDTTTAGVGTVNYMAPEQFFPKKYGLNQGISERTDIWAFGIILYRLLTGSLPFTSQEQITDTEVNLAPVPASYRNVVRGCLQKHADKRYASAKDVIVELDKIKPTKAVKSKPSFPVKTIAIVAACIAVLVGAVFFIYKSTKKEIINNNIVLDFTLIPTESANSKIGYLNQSLNRAIIPFKYDDWPDLFFTDGIAPAIRNNAWGAIDKEGKEVIPIKYDDFGLSGSDPWDNLVFIKDGLIAAKLNRKWGFIDKTGSVKIPFKYDNEADCAIGLAAVSLNGKWGIINKAGKEIIPFKYERMWQFHEGLAAVELNHKVGFIDSTGKEVIPLKYDEISNFSEGFASVKLNGKWGFVDSMNNETVSPKYYEVRDLHDGLAMVLINETPNNLDATESNNKVDLLKNKNTSPISVKEGFIDKTGTVVIPFKHYDRWMRRLGDGGWTEGVGDFCEGLSKIKLNGKWGFMDKTGNTIIPTIYDNAEDFSEGLAAVTLNGKSDYIDKSGNQIISTTYDNIGDFSEGLATVNLNGKYGYIDKTGNVAIPIKFVYATKFKDGHAFVKEKNLFGESSYVIDKNGSMVNTLVIKLQ